MVNEEQGPWDRPVVHLLHARKLNADPSPVGSAKAGHGPSLLAVAWAPATSTPALLAQEGSSA